MSRFALVAAFVSAAALVARLPAADPTDWKVIASVASVGGKPEIPITVDDGKEPTKRERGRVIRGKADLATALHPDPKQASDPETQKKAEDWAATVLKVDRIEWTRQMLLALDAGTVRGGQQVRVVSLKADGAILTVTWDLTPGEGKGLADARALLLVPRFEGEVRFVRAEPKK